MENWISLVNQQMRVQCITQEQLAALVGVSQSTVSQWVRGRATPHLKTQNRVLRALGIAEVEFATVLQTQETRATYTSSLPEGALPGEGYRYPCIEWDAAGVAGERCSASWMFSHYRARGKAYWLQVGNDAMASPQGWSVPEGAWVLVDPGKVHQLRSLVIATLGNGDGVVFRQWVEEAGRYYLRALNPNWPMLEVEQGCQVLGVVVNAVSVFVEG